MYCISHAGDRVANDDGSDSSGLSTGAVAVITFAVTFTVSVTATAIITFIVAYVCIRRTPEKANRKANTSEKGNTYESNDPIPQQIAVYDDVCVPSKTVTKKHLMIQQNPSHSTSREVIRAINPAYENL